MLGSKKPDIESEARVGSEQYLAGNIDGGQKITEV